MRRSRHSSFDGSGRVLSPQAQAEIDEQEAEGHFRTARNQPAAVNENESEARSRPPGGDGTGDALPPGRFDRCTPLQAQFADRLGLRDPNVPYTPKPHELPEKPNRAVRRAMQSRARTLRSYSRTLFKETF